MIVPFVNYIIRSSIGLVVFYLLYISIYSKDRYHNFNRYFLLFSLFFSLLIPLIHFNPLFLGESANTSFDIIDFQEKYYQFPENTEQFSASLNKGLIYIFVYCIISLFFLVRYTLNLSRLILNWYRLPKISVNGHVLALTKDKTLPFTFISIVFVNESDFKNNSIPKELLLHEFAHVDQRHSFDILLIELLKAVFWINPIFIFYKKAMILNHEYLADNAVTKITENPIYYLNMLLNFVSGKNNSYLASSFNHSLIKKRVLMLTKTNCSKKATLKRIITLPVIFLIGLLVLNAQEIPVAPEQPPPPPPPIENSLWWSSILAQHKISVDPSSSLQSTNVYFTGDQLIKEDSKITIKNAVILARSINGTYRIVKAKSATQYLADNRYECQNATIETYNLNDDGTSTLTDTEYYMDFNFKIVNDIIAPPPPSPPQSPPTQTPTQDSN